MDQNQLLSQQQIFQWFQEVTNVLSMLWLSVVRANLEELRMLLPKSVTKLNEASSQVDECTEPLNEK